jgi:hypothetical protein
MTWLVLQVPCHPVKQGFGMVFGCDLSGSEQLQVFGTGQSRFLLFRQGGPLLESHEPDTTRTNN